MFYRVLGLLLVSSVSWATTGWNVDCGTHCFFSEFPHNCQGVYWQDDAGNRSYAGWSDSYGACEEADFLTGNFHIIASDLISCGCSTPTVFPPADQAAAMTSATRARLELLRAQVQSWTACAPDPARAYSSLFSPISYKDLDTCQYLRKNGKRREFVAVGIGCYSGMSPAPDPSWANCTYGGDEVSNMAMNCLAGDQDRCFDIKDAQDPVTGGWYRNAYFRRHPEAIGQTSFSRDGLMGLLAYVTATHDKEALRKWLVFVSTNMPKLAGGAFFSLCPNRPDPKPTTITADQWNSLLPNDACNMIPEAWGQVYFAALAVGLTHAELHAISTEIYSAMASGGLALDNTLYGEAGTAPALGTGSYQIGDTMDAINIRNHTPGGVNSTTASAASLANDRTGRLNPYYHYLAHAQTATEYGAYLLSKYCKGTRPPWGEWFGSGFNSEAEGNSSWYWNDGSPIHVGNYQYLGGWGPYGMKPVPSGHECIGLLNLYLGNNHLTELQCDSGDTLINGACEKFSFVQPKLAPIYGIDYKIRTSDSKITYAATDRLTCPYGGSLEPGTVRCALSSGISSSLFSSSVNYWVDPYPGWPGVYYADGSGNHAVQSYSQPILYPGINYWVDSNPSWPGVYYAKISGACPHGGDASGTNCKIQGFSSGFLDTNVTYFARSNPAHPGVYYYPSVIPEITFHRVGTGLGTGDRITSGTTNTTVTAATAGAGTKTGGGGVIGPSLKNPCILDGQFADVPGKPTGCILVESKMSTTGSGSSTTLATTKAVCSSKVNVNVAANPGCFQIYYCLDQPVKGNPTDIDSCLLRTGDSTTGSYIETKVPLSCGSNKLLSITRKTGFDQCEINHVTNVKSSTVGTATGRGP